MRTIAILLIIAGLALAPLAAAEGGRGSPPPAASAHREAAENHSAQGDHKATDHTSASSRMAAFRTAMAAIMHSWQENATKVREDCRAAEKPANDSTHDERTQWAQCIRDGYHAFFAQMRAERQEARAAWKTLN